MRSRVAAAATGYARRTDRWILTDEAWAARGVRARRAVASYEGRAVTIPRGRGFTHARIPRTRKKYVEGVRSRARVVSAGELVDDVGDERPDDSNGIGDAAAGAGGVDDERALVRSRRDADEAS